MALYSLLICGIGRNGILPRLIIVIVPCIHCDRLRDVLVILILSEDEFTWIEVRTYLDLPIRYHEKVWRLLYLHRDFLRRLIPALIGGFQSHLILAHILRAEGMLLNLQLISLGIFGTSDIEGLDFSLIRGLTDLLCLVAILITKYRLLILSDAWGCRILHMDCVGICVIQSIATDPVVSDGLSVHLRGVHTSTL